MHQTIGWKEFVLRTKLKAAQEQKEEQKVKTSHIERKRKQGRKKRDFSFVRSRFVFARI